MKNNKAFTLVELLAVIVILMIILTLITPKVFKQLKTAGEVTDKEQINSIIDTSRLYMNQHSELLPEHNSLYIITLNELKESGLIKSSQILNPSTNEELTGCVIVSYENNKYKYEYKEDNCDKVIAVTFDPQGGELTQTSKIVTTNEPYGSLPTPTREGYTFMGWNGKNLFNGLFKQYTIQNEKNYTNDDLKGRLTYSNLDSKYYTFGGYFQAGTYVFNINSDDHWYSLNRVAIAGTNCIQVYNIRSPYTWTQSMDGYTYFSIERDTDLDDLTDIKFDQYDFKLQLEEGDTATPYEPYYITPTTTVVQETNHTLKAIWQANS